MIMLRVVSLPVSVCDVYLRELEKANGKYILEINKFYNL
jgi:hypothetical protein